MGNCLPRLVHESRRCKNKISSHGAAPPLNDHVDEAVGLPQAVHAHAPRSSKGVATTTEAETPRSKPSVVDDDGKKDAVRVKVVVTKKEADWLLSVLAGGEERAVEDVLRDVEEGNGWSCSSTKPVSRRDSCCRPALEIIPEIN